MRAFPSLVPDKRDWEFPRFPTLDYEGAGGTTLSFEFGDTPSDQPIDLVFLLISEAEMQQIRDHYIIQQSVHPFPLSPRTLYGSEDFPNLFDTTTLYLYREEPEEEVAGPGLYNVTITLRSVRP